MKPMTNTNDPASLNADVRARWDTNAEFWDARMGEGNPFHLELVEPATLKLLELEPGERVLEIARGNGQFARKLASLGANVTATDFSPNMIERAHAHSEPFNARVNYQVLDATDENALGALGEHAFDAVICNMALMDMVDIEPLFRALPQLLKPRGRFVFSITHPCFNTSGMRMSLEEEVVGGEIVDVYALKLTRYLQTTPTLGIAMFGQPALQYYFDRPLHVLFGAAFRAGLVMDGLEERAFHGTHTSTRLLSWENYPEFPPILVARLRVGEH